jgi:PIN domain nuclease of toxin-antitoxin system
VKLLLDTHVVIWLFNEPAKIIQPVATLICDVANDVYVSAASPWEIAIKVHSGKLKFDTGFLDDFDSRLDGLGFRTLAMTSAHGVAAARLPGTHKDPFDRMIGAQAILEQMTLVSTDAAFKSLGVPVFWS